MMPMQFLPLAAAVPSARDLVQSITQLQSQVRVRLRQAITNNPTEWEAVTVSAGHQLLDIFAQNLNSILDMVAFGTHVNSAPRITDEQLTNVLGEMRRQVEVALGSLQAEFFDPVVSPHLELVRNARRAGNIRVEQMVAMFSLPAFQQRIEMTRPRSFPFLFPGFPGFSGFPGFFPFAMPRAQPQQPQTRPAAKHVVDSLPLVVVSDEEKACSICLETFAPGQIATQLPCGHIFCASNNNNNNNKSNKTEHADSDEAGCCGGAQQWLEEHNTCPVCRFELPTHTADKSQPSCTSSAPLHSHQASWA